MKFCFFCLALILSSRAQAEGPAAPPEPSKWEKVKDTALVKVSEAQAALNAARENRASTPWSVIADYSFFETWVLSKYGFTVAYNGVPSASYEFEYMKGSLGFGYFGIDIGKIGEQKATLIWRSFNQRNTLNFITGIYYNRFDVHLGSDLLATVTGNQQNSVNLAELTTMGLTWGVGNRWQTKNGFVWGADWFVVNIPLTVLSESTPFVDASSSEEKRKQVSDGMKVFKHVPAFAIIKVQLGFSF